MSDPFPIDRISYQVVKKAIPTISDDHSEGRLLQQRKLLALHDPEYRPPLSDLAEGFRTAAPNKSHDLGQFSRESVASESKGGRHVSSIEAKYEYSVPSLESHIAFLEAKIKHLEAGSNTAISTRHQILYRLRGNEPESDSKKAEDKLSFETQAYLGPPEKVKDQDGDIYLRCSVPVTNFGLYLATNPGISFIVFRDYPRKINRNQNSPSGYPVKPQGATWNPKPLAEAIYPVSKELKEALAVILEGTTEYTAVKTQYMETKELSAPYLFVYHGRDKFRKMQECLSEAQWSQFELLLDYVQSNFGGQYSKVDSLMGKGEIREECVHYYFKPGDILVVREAEEYRGYVAGSWVRVEARDDVEQGNNHKKKLSPEGNPKHQLRKQTRTWSIRGTTWNFDGEFYEDTKTLTFDIPLIDSHNTEETDILFKGISVTSLAVFPLRFAPKELVDKLRKRGETLWKCRAQRLVSYQASEQEKLDNKTDDRYMIDMKSYRYLHTYNTRVGDGGSILDPGAMLNDEPPPDPFLLLVPPTIKGYNLRRKKWFEISIDRISDVTWNKQAFNSLVMDRKSKDFIQALISNHLESEKSTDLIAGKGNGLILLLHGGPGTGKTLTAESVAEIAEKPLYRVTCGDVGIEPEKVEKYLDSVLHLGKIWGCVVLLDEADVFLEQRSLEDLARNALVSVFLRVLEYYDGILILTSNRVGTFDEAFRSRIQLALHYPNLGPHQRYRIWKTLIARLKSMEGETIDIDGLEDRLEELKDEKLNGRQIRNVITTARQYARWKKTALTYEHLKDAMEVSGRFDTYLDKLHGGHSPDEIAQDEGLRLA